MFKSAYGRKTNIAQDLHEALLECLEVLDELEKHYQRIDEDTHKKMVKAVGME